MFAKGIDSRDTVASVSLSLSDISKKGAYDVMVPIEGLLAGWLEGTPAEDTEPSACSSGERRVLILDTKSFKSPCLIQTSSAADQY